MMHVIPHLDRQTRVEQPLLLEDQSPALGHADVHGAAGVGSWLRSIYFVDNYTRVATAISISSYHTVHEVSGGAAVEVLAPAPEVDEEGVGGGEPLPHAGRVRSYHAVSLVLVVTTHFSADI